MMATSKPDLEFPFLKDVTQLIQHESILYKVKVRYDHDSFQGRKISCTNLQLSYEIEEALRAVLYMIENRISFTPIQTDFCLIIPHVKRWSFPIKHQNYLFKRNGITLEVSDISIEFQVKHVEVLNSDKKQKTLQEKVKTRGSQVLKREEKTSEIEGVVLPVRSDNDSSTSGKLKVKVKNVKEKTSSVQNKKTNANSKTATSVASRETRKEAVNPSLQRDPNNARKPGTIPDVNVNSEKNIAKTNPKSPNACIDCLEEQQFRRRSTRLKRDVKNGCSEVNTTFERTLIHDRNNSSIPYQKQNTKMISADDTTIMAMLNKRSTDAVNGVTDLPDIRKTKRRRRTLPSSAPVEPADTLQIKNKDRYVLEQLERDEINKLGELYDTTSPRRSLRQPAHIELSHTAVARRSPRLTSQTESCDAIGPRRSTRQAVRPEGRLSGMWSRLWGSFFTPNK